MTILITTIPDDPKEWAGWLEQHLVGIRLRDLIDELRLIPDSALISLKSLLNETPLLEVRKRGLASLTVNQIRALMASPQSLLELQEDVLVNGGEYWRSLPPDHDVQHSLERVRVKLKKPASQEDRARLATEYLTAARSRSKFLVGLVSAAAILLIGVVAWRMQPGGSGSILCQPGLLVNDVVSSAVYLNRIADAGSEWFDQRPADSAQLISLLQNVSGDYQILIDAEHQALTPAERDWFVTKCQNWKKEFDTTLASLQSGFIAIWPTDPRSRPIRRRPDDAEACQRASCRSECIVDRIRLFAQMQVNFLNNIDTYVSDRRWRGVRSMFQRLRYLFLPRFSHTEVRSGETDRCEFAPRRSLLRYTSTHASNAVATIPQVSSN